MQEMIHQKAKMGRKWARTHLVTTFQLHFCKGKKEDEGRLAGLCRKSALPQFTKVSLQFPEP